MRDGNKLGHSCLSGQFVPAPPLLSLPQLSAIGVGHCSHPPCAAWHRGMLCQTPMSAKLYVLISWPDGSRVINIENIKEPRKPFHLYTVGEQVLARCPGFSGLYWGMVEAQRCPGEEAAGRQTAPGDVK
uniref:Uncharacterized protein n=1 Tax=Anas zonorhyncha TaxID=75864 RepID=A0A8B9V451_9AVES